MEAQATSILAQIYRNQFGKMVGALMYHTTIKDITFCEDIVQEAFAVAAEKWPIAMPDHPTAWLFKTIRNLALNALKDENRKRLFEAGYDNFITSEAVEEEQLLKVLYHCVQSAFSPKVQLVIALRYINGLQVKRIAALLGTDDDGISKILYRWRAQCKDHQWDFTKAVNFYDHKSVRRVLKVAYVMFTEGYRVTVKGQLADPSLCEDALGILQALIKKKVVMNGEVKALYALLLYHLARSCSRTNDINELVELAAQDRSCWNKAMIEVANAYLLASKRESKGANSYQLQAAITYLQVTAPTFECIDWQRISALYTQLRKLDHSPFIALNHAAAMYLGGQQAGAMKLLEQLGQHRFFRNHHLLHCLWAKIYTDQSHKKAAKSSYKAALQSPINALEEQFIKKKIAELDQP